MKEVRIQSPFMGEIYQFEKVAKQASGSVLYHHNGTVLLASVAVEEDRWVEGDFLPLTIQYIEKTYASAKFPSGFIKREGKPSDFETLTSRIIDRTLRPLFPKNYRHPTQITIMVLSYDGKSDLQVCALNAASSALYISSIPIYFPTNAVRIGKNEKGFIVNPNTEELHSSTLDLYVSGCYSDILMIEMQSLQKDCNAQEMSEEDFCEAIELAKKVIDTHSKLYEENFQSLKKEAFSILEVEEKSEVVEWIRQNALKDLHCAILQMAKSERASALHKLAEKIQEQQTQWSKEEIVEALEVCKKEVLRKMILQERLRADGRGLKDVRPIQIETNLLPYAHGSCLFTRGETQALVVSTIGSESDAQSFELLGDKVGSKERFMVHYNFPGFSVGEASMISAPGRRELGHGNLAKRALESSLQDRRVVRLVSEILESNGSSSMATVCGGSLALKASGVETQTLIAGVAMGLVKEGQDYAILTDIMGLEDHCGDMDFKVAGSDKGITALQMDIKLGGIDSKILREAIMQAKEARLYILNLMREAEEKICINEGIVPISLSFEISPDRIVEIIGQGGKTIKEIIERFGVTIDLDRVNGIVYINGMEKDKLEETKNYILALLEKPQTKVDFSVYVPHSEFDGRIKKIVDFGAFIELPYGGDGLLHISKIRTKGLKLNEGEIIRCKILSIDKNKVELDAVL